MNLKKLSTLFFSIIFLFQFFGCEAKTDAKINSNPQLEIYCDDVQCAHGSTIGELDEDAILYLRSRGISLNESKNILLN